METVEIGPFEYADKIPLKTDFAGRACGSCRGSGPLGCVTSSRA